MPAVGEIADRIARAWAGVRSYRSVFTTTQRLPGTPAPSVVTIEVIEEAVLPDRRHRIMRENGVVTAELIIVGSTVYVRGIALPGFSTPRPDPDAWLLVDPAIAQAGDDVASLYAAVATPIAPPYAALSPEERLRDAVPLDRIEIGGRTCQRYRIADTTMTGERVEILLALGPDDLPCSIETSAGGTDSRSVFTYNLPITIVPPELATPIASPTG